MKAYVAIEFCVRIARGSGGQGVAYSNDSCPELQAHHGAAAEKIALPRSTNYHFCTPKPELGTVQDRYAANAALLCSVPAFVGRQSQERGEA